MTSPGTADTSYAVERATVTSITTDTLTPGTNQYAPLHHEEVVVALSNNSHITNTISVDYIDMTDRLSVGEQIYVTRIASSTAIDAGSAPQYTYGFLDIDRMPMLYSLGITGLVLLILIGGRQGIRGLLSLCISIVIVWFVLLPNIIHGGSPIILSSAVIIFVASIGAYITHGFNRMTTAAILGMGVTLLCSTILTVSAVHGGHLSGILDDTSSYLEQNPAPGTSPIDFQGILLGSILISILGVMYDAAINQAVAVEELLKATPQSSLWYIYTRALRIGREHIGALVNTLVLAYIGISMPIMISTYVQYTVYDAGYATQPLINMEFFATEIVRIFVGSIGIIITIPITTLCAICFLAPHRIFPHFKRLLLSPHAWHDA